MPTVTIVGRYAGVEIGRVQDTLDDGELVDDAAAGMALNVEWAWECSGVTGDVPVGLPRSGFDALLARCVGGSRKAGLRAVHRAITGAAWARDGAADDARVVNLADMARRPEGDPEGDVARYLIGLADARGVNLG